MQQRGVACRLATACLLLVIVLVHAAPPNTGKVMFKFGDQPGGAMRVLGAERIAKIARNSRQTGLTPREVADALDANDDMVSILLIELLVWANLPQGEEPGCLQLFPPSLSCQ